MLSDAEKTDARRFLGYPVYAAGQFGRVGWALVQASGSVDYRLSNLSQTEEAVFREYLDTLRSLERSIPGSAVALDTQSAGGWVRNPTELGERMRLFDDWRRRFCAFLGLPPGPELNRGRDFRLVV